MKNNLDPSQSTVIAQVSSVSGTASAETGIVELAGLFISQKLYDQMNQKDECAGRPGSRDSRRPPGSIDEYPSLTD